jgi:hypothetical protein
MSVTVLDREIFSEAEAARLLRVAQGTLHYWLDGGQRRGRTYPPVIRAKPRDGRIVTWAEFVEAGLLRVGDEGTASLGAVVPPPATTPSRSVLASFDRATARGRRREQPSVVMRSVEPPPPKPVQLSQSLPIVPLGALASTVFPLSLRSRALERAVLHSRRAVLAVQGTAYLVLE